MRELAGMLTCQHRWMQRVGQRGENLSLLRKNNLRRVHIRHRGHGLPLDQPYHGWHEILQR